MAGLFTRILRLGKAEAHSAVDKFEDPIKMTEQGIRDLKKDKQFERRIFYGKYICREWYDGAIVNGVSLKRFELYFMKETTRPPGLAPVMGTELLWSHECLSD